MTDLDTAHETPSDPSPRASEPKRRRAIGKWLPAITTPVVLVLFVVGWDLSIRIFDISRFILPKPSAVFESLVDLVQFSWFYEHLRITMTEVLAGFTIACVTAIVIGVILGKSPTLEKMFNPLIVGLQVTPKVALMPLILVVLGFGIASKIAIAAVLSFFPILRNTVLGIRSIPREHRELFLIINASSLQRVRKLEIPFLLPYLLTGIETAVVFSVTGAIVGEYLAGQWGLGALVVISLNNLQVPRLFATVLVLALVGFALYFAVASLRRVLIPWHESSGSAPSV